MDEAAIRDEYYRRGYKDGVKEERRRARMLAATLEEMKEYVAGRIDETLENWRHFI